MTMIQRFILESEAQQERIVGIANAVSVLMDKIIGQTHVLRVVSKDSNKRWTMVPQA